MVQGIIMAGGEGSRLRPLTCDRPKPMVPVLNRPVMEYAVELLKKHGITDIGVTLQYMPQEIINYFRDGSGLDVNMQFFIEDSPLGTAGSVKNAEGFIKDTFVIISGDALTDFDISEALAYHKEKKAIATLVLTPVEIPLEYGVVITEKSGEIRQFLEKPGWGEVFSDTVNTGIYILEPEVLSYIPEGQKFDFSKDLFPILLEEGKPLYGVSLRGYWCDIGNLRQYQEAHFDVLEGKVSVHRATGYHATGNQTTDRIDIGENSTISSSAKLNGPVVIGNGCRINDNAVVGPHVVLGDNCIVDEGASVKKSVVWNGSYIGRMAELRGIILGNKVVMKDRARAFEGAVIGDGCIIEENVKIKPDIKIWPNKSIEKDSVLGENLVWGPRACRSMFGADGISGKINIDITPECAAKLGAVYGTVLGKDSAVLISSDGHRANQMIKMALESGLVSVGVNVADGGILTTPVHRNSVRGMGVTGGVHVKSSVSNPETVHVNFFSRNGSMILRDTERKIENLMERDDFQRTSKQRTGELSYMPGLNESYIQYLFGLINADMIRHRNYRVVAGIPEQNLLNLIPAIFSGLGCELLNFNTGPQEVNHVNSTASAKEPLAHQVVRNNASIGLVFDSNAEHVTLIDERGNIVSEELYTALMSLIILETSRYPVVAVPVTGSGVVESLAETYKGNVVRTKTAPAAFYNEVMKPEISTAQGDFNQSVMTFDALSTVVRILEYMSIKGQSLGEITSRIPEIYMARKQTSCPWEAKGKVMRTLIEETPESGHRVELLDGVKVYHENGWALVLPDAGEPVYHVYTEGASTEFAEELANFYIDKISQLTN